MTLSVGDKLPVFSLEADDGRTVTNETVTGDGPFIIYFYPKDDTPGCTVEACTFRDQYEAFTDAGAQVYGVSGDSRDSHVAFKAKHRLPFTLLSDPGRQVAKAFGVGKRLGILPGRVTFVFDASGELRMRFTSDFNMKKHVTASLDVIQGL